MHILVVEDDNAIRDILFLVAESAFPGARVSGAKNGAEALAACRDGLPDLALLDLGLPDISGFEVLSRMNSLGRAGRVVIVTAEDRPEHRSLADSLGAAAYVTKPFDGRSLREVLRKVMQQGQTEHALSVTA